MTAFAASILALLADPAVLVALGAALVGGMVRGFAGFGGALVFIPIAAAAVGPAVAAPALLLFDGIGTLPLLRRAWPAADRRVVLPMAAGALLFVPVGAFVLLTLDAVPLRWLISGLIAAAALMIGAGLRWPGPPKLGASLGVGAVAGFCGGLAQISGPPVVLYLLGGGGSAAATRASVFAFFGINTITSFVTYAVSGLLTREVLLLALLYGPVYAIGLFFGSRLFPIAPERFYRRLALGLILAAAVLGSPLVR
ncbi:sulfite exporter TauE/SafE family protein [Methylobrevis albus]|uniref:Probable membrane transporter protein n=1 Tax=Methylobrevis albus TaxID=2793297 RepID=A0A931I5U6_9HYPH|nr:sulfite exporter TauE/SafE family protein [Methylobrevis albus]MBH0239383.1 sulfite exporter TauE/SafE family protein [Methylobrevis albus]